MDSTFSVNDESYAAIDFQAPRAGEYQVSFFTDGEEVGGVAVVVADPGGEIYSIDFSTNELPIVFTLDKGGLYTFLITLGLDQPESEINMVIEDAQAVTEENTPGSTTTTGPAKVVPKYVPKKKTVTQVSQELTTKYRYMYFVNNDEVLKKVFGTSWKNAFGFMSRDAQSALGGKFIFSGKLPAKYRIKMEIMEFAKDQNAKLETFTVIKKEIETTNGINVLTFTSSVGKIRGSSRYMALLYIYDSSTNKVAYYRNADISLDYKMSLLCSSTLLTLTTLQDTSVGFLKSVSLLSTAVNGVFTEVLGEGPLAKMAPAKRAKILGKLLSLNKAGTIASQGLDLIEFAGAVGAGDRVQMKILVKGKITKELKDKFDIQPYKAGQFYVVVNATREQSADLVKFMSTQGSANGDAITATCAR
ncbi:MAG: hypothetical protein NTW43_04955 [Actinobacteria bacterium]|nr:hypothetical protein [Actinomycetota bacterium]